MLHLLYFAWVKERMGRNQEQLELPASIATVGSLITWLQSRDESGARTFLNPSVIRAAVNQDFASPDTPIRDGDEVAFFPPVTGG